MCTRALRDRRLSIYNRHRAHVGVRGERDVIRLFRTRSLYPHVVFELPVELTPPYLT